MKNGGRIILLIFAFSLTFLLGTFVGRNLRSDYVILPENGDRISETLSSKSIDYRLDINTATKVQLMELPGIGEIIAEQIIQYRTQNGPFADTDDLLNVDGIGEKKLLKIEPLIRAGGYDENSCCG